MSLSANVKEYCKLKGESVEEFTLWRKFFCEGVCAKHPDVYALMMRRSQAAEERKDTVKDTSVKLEDAPKDD